MRYEQLDIIAPYVLGDEYKFNEAEVLGSAVWLWMRSAARRNVPLNALSALFLPAIERRQFVLGSEHGKPVFYLAWANLSLDAEKRYLESPPQRLPAEDWSSGNRIWFLDWIAPFGHSRRMKSLITRQFFPGWCARGLYHRGRDEGQRVISIRGVSVSPEEARFWFQHDVPVAGKVPMGQKQTSVVARSLSPMRFGP